MAFRKIPQASNGSSDSWALREEDEDEEEHLDARPSILGLDGARVRREPRRSMSYSAQTPHGEAVKHSTREMHSSSLRLRSSMKELEPAQPAASDKMVATAILSTYTATNRATVSCDDLDGSGGRESSAVMSHAKESSV
ncbi:hypothetical protein EV175_003748, partial [Coemansia sp. RSA 1933]